MKKIPLPNVSYEALQLNNIGPITKFLGVTTLDPFNAPIGSATSVKNVTAAGGVFPSLTTRPSFSPLGAGFGASVTGMALHLNAEPNAVAGGIWRKYTAGAWSNVLTGLNATAQWSFTNFQGAFPKVNLIGVNGVDPAKKYDGTTISDLAGVPSGVKFKMIDQHGDRVYASDGKAIYMSGLRKAEDWTSADSVIGANVYQIETNTGEDVCAIKAGMKHLMVFKRNAFFELWGTNSTNHQLQQIAETGAVGLNAVTVHDEAGYWIHDSGAFRYTGGLPRKDFSMPVIEYFKQMNKSAAQNACAISTRDSVLFSIPTGTSTVNDTTLEYLPAYGIWSIWKDFSPTAWLYWNNKLTYGDGTGVYQQADNSTGVSWEWVSPPFGGGAFSTINQWYKLMYVLDIPVGSQLTVYVSSKSEGNAPADWIEVTSTAGIEGMPIYDRRVVLPLQQVANSNWLRLKIAGTGPIKFHEINIQQRALPLR